MQRYETGLAAEYVFMRHLLRTRFLSQATTSFRQVCTMCRCR